MKSENKTSKNMLYQKISGLLLVVGSIQFMLFVTVAETLYPGYNTGINTLSDLADLPIYEPSATIFNITVFLLGLCLAVAAYLIYRQFGNKIFPALLAVSGIGIMGVGIFPGHTGGTHVLFAMTSFVFGSLAVITSFTLLRNSWLKYIIPVLGAIGFVDILLVILLQEASPFMVLGEGGAERLIAYPVILGLIALGGYLMGSVPTKESLQ